ncbi:MAG TPA: outer membrane beta-barrel protein [Saprospiraceae bacterium]|nr:outer membrane beta-barrel protein [Saprospiraceae bacterium]HMP15264.1 outer membrane beta-barrel protein [Saprospiraceae bacterium]
MKYNSCIALILLGSISPLMSQVSIGLSGGGGIDHNTSLRMALPLEYTFSPSFSIQTAFNFTQQHNQQLINRLRSDQAYRQVTISYVGIPVLAKFRLNFRSMSLTAASGPQLSYGLHFVAVSETGHVEELEFENLNINRFDIAMHMGVGVEREIRNQAKLFIHYFHQIGVNDIDFNKNSDIYNESRILTIGILFPLHQR